jgi:SAM-dependent methyltransferase
MEVSVRVPDATQASKHYDAKYFKWQESIGEFGGWASYYMFKTSIKPEDTVIDFGCGGGFLLNNLDCREKIGIEPNSTVVDALRRKNIRHFFNSTEALHELGEGIADVIISNHALEHTLNPLQEIKNLLPLLKRGGIFHILVPCEAISTKYRVTDINHHLFTWCPQNLGNLFTEAGYKVDYSKPYVHKWPPFYCQFSSLGWPIFNILCRVYGQIDRRSFQVELRATKQLT